MNISRGRQIKNELWRNTLWLVIGLLVCGALLVAANWEANRREQLQMNNFRGDIADLARISESIIAGKFREFDDTLRVLRDAFSKNPETFPEQVKLLRQGPLVDPTVLVVIVDRNGYLTFTDTPNVKSHLFLGDRKYFRYFADGGKDSLYIDEPTFGRVTQRYTLPLVRPMYDPQGHFAGVAALSVTQESLSRLGPRQQLSGDIAITVINHGGAVVSRSRDLEKFQGSKIQPRLLKLLLNGVEGVFINDTPLEGTPHVIAYQHVYHDATPLIVFVESSLDKEISDISWQRRFLLGSAGFISLLILFLIATYLNRRKISEQLIRSLRQGKEQEYNALTQTSRDGFWIADTAGRFLDTNDTFCSLLGYSREDLLGLTISDIEVLESQAQVAEHIRTIIAAGYARFQSHLRCKDGRSIDVELSVQYVGDPAGKLFVFTRDITEQKIQESAHEQAAQLLQIINIQNDLHDCLATLTASLKEWSGCEAVGIRLRSGNDFPYFETRGFPAEFVQAENSLCAYDENGEILRDEQGNPVLECMCGNILSGRFDPSLPFFTPRGSFWTNSTSVLLASTKEADLQVRTRNRCHGEGHESVALIPMRAGDLVIGLLQFNDPRPNNFTPALIETFEGMAETLALTLERRRVEAELYKSEKRFRSLLNTIPDLIWLKDEAGVYLSCNRTFEKLLGVNELDIVGKTDYDFFDRDQADFFRENDRLAIATGRARSNEEWVTFADNSYRALLLTTKVPMYEADGKIIGVLGVGRDITELKQAQEERSKLEHQLQQAQKIESIGHLAGGVAHDFNNMLGVILGHAELALMKADPSNPFIANLEEISKAAKRSADLTRQLLTFARKQTIAPRVLDLNQTVAGMLKMLQRLIGENIQLSWHPAAHLWPIKMDPSQIDQVLANLCVNARDAISGNGKITIATENCSFSETDLSEHQNLLPGDYVRLTVSDDGCGMDKKTLEQIFEPFFTTKEIGSGTGLGLATVYGAIRQNNGFINVYSEPGLGTTFTIYLPKDQTEAKSLQDLQEKPLQGGTETILLVEDDEMLLQLKSMMLQQSGYRILATASAESAQTLAIEHQGPIHLMVSDVIMPVMNGKELAKRLQPLRPEMRVLFMSGYTADIISSQGVLEKGIHFLQKPVSYETLTRKVREVLDTPPLALSTP